QPSWHGRVGGCDPTPLDIEHLFDQDGARTEQTFQSPSAPTTDTRPSDSAAKEPGNGDDPSRTRGGPRPDRVVRRKSTRDHLGRGASPRHAPRVRARGGGRLSRHHRTPDVVRGRDATGAPRADVPASLATLDDHGTRRGAPRRRLTTWLERVAHPLGI